MTVYGMSAYERAVNSWEHSVVHAMDPTPVSLQTVRGICQYVWQLYGLPGKPPVAREITSDDPDYISGCVASVTALSFHLYRPVSTSVVLHEMAHLITDEPLNELERRPLVEREFHGKIFLSNFLHMLDRLMGPRFNQLYLRSTMPPQLQQGLPWHPTVWGEPRPKL